MSESPHVLIVDDNEMDTELAAEAFRHSSQGTVVHAANNGQQALDYLLGRKPYSDRKLYPLPRLVLLDIKMPGMDGLEVLQKVKGDDSIKHLPVIMLTSSADQRDRARSYELGANSYLVKPVSFGQFRTMVGVIEAYWLNLNVTA